MNEYLVSICIPTYNRSEILRETIQDIVMNRGFTDDVELVISDNCSTDNTEEVVHEFSEKYENIKYYKNPKNVRDENFWIALNHGQGEYIKLQNDYSSFSEDGLVFLKEKIKESSHEENIFFTDDKIYTKKGIQEQRCSDINEFIEYLANFTTFINLFGIWKNDLPLIEDPLIDKERKLTQEGWFYQLVQKKHGCILVNKRIMRKLYTHTIPREVKYNFFEIQIKNYYDIMQRFTESAGCIPGIIEETVKNDKENVVRYFRTEYFATYIYTSDEFTFDREMTTKILDTYCADTKRYIMYKKILPFMKILYPLFVIRISDNPIKRFAKKILGK